MAWLQRAAGNAAVAASVQRQEITLQRTKKQNIEGKGFTGEEAELLKTIMGGWVAADKLVQGGITPEYLRIVRGDHDDNLVRKKALLNLSPHFYGVAKHLAIVGGVSLAALIRKDLTDRTVDVMTGYPVPVFRATILSMASVAQITDISGLGDIFASYPAFDPVVTAQLGAAPADLNPVIGWLSKRSKVSREYLEANAPDFAVLKLLARSAFSDSSLVRLGHFGKEDPPDNNDYEAIGTKGKSYRVGHFARFHTVRGMSEDNALVGDKTIWPLETTVEDIRTICQEFDAATQFDTQQRYWFNPTVVPGQVVVDAHGSGFYEPSSFDQMYPRVGALMTVELYDEIVAVRALKPNWTEPA